MITHKTTGFDLQVVLCVLHCSWGDLLLSFAAFIAAAFTVRYVTLYVWTLCNAIRSYGEQMLATRPTTQPGGQLLVCCRNLLIQYIRSYLSN